MKTKTGAGKSTSGNSGKTTKSATPKNPAVKKGVKGFVPGHSGNPRGRPRGSRNRTTMLTQQLLDTEAGAVASKLIELALEGDPTAMKIYFDRILPPINSRHVEIELPPIERLEDLPRAHSAILDAVASGTLAPAEAKTVVELLEAKRRALYTAEIAKKFAMILRKLEQSDGH